MALVDEVLQLREEEDWVQGVLFCPAGVGALVTGRTIWMNLYQEGVVVAVNLDAYQVEKVARCLALGPKTVAGTAPEGNLLGFDGLIVCFPVHEAQHQDVLGYGILDDGWNKSAHFFKIYFHFIFTILSVCPLFFLP